jgi:leucyl aminopeptidase
MARLAGLSEETGMFESVRIGKGGKAEVLVLGCFKGEGLDKDSKSRDADGAIGAALARGEATGELGRIVEAFPGSGGGARAKSKRAGAAARVMVVGLGEKSKFEAGKLRDAAAAVGRRLAVTKNASVEVDLEGAVRAASKGRADIERAGATFGEGLGLIAWTFDTFKGTTRKNSRTKLTVSSSSAAFTRGLERGLAMAESANLARTLSQTPPNFATPYWMAAEAQKMSRKVGLKCTVLKGDQLKRERLNGMIEVGKASENKPCMIRMEWRPRGAKGKPLVLVGKTICYDTGGLSLKINNGMRGMKRDKDGGCAVFGAMHAIATVIQPKRPVVGIMVAAENSISDEAYRPDDVITFRNGVTAEITNTDAEGRLVLADGLCWACEKEDPAAVIDMATLTGGVVVALGSTFAGMWCDDDALRAKVEAASNLSGERVWRLPHHDEYRDMMKSDVADIINSNPNRKAHPIQGAAFLSYFVEEGVPWCHLDIAGVHASESDKGPFIKESATGFGVRLVAELAESF